MTLSISANFAFALLSSFIFFEGIFGLVYLGYVFYTRAIDMGQISPDGRNFYTLYVWIGLFFGAHNSAVGTLYTSPGLLSRSSAARTSKRFTIRSLIPSPLLCNLWFIGYPALVGAAMIVIGALAGYDYRESKYSNGDQTNNDEPKGCSHKLSPDLQSN